jgi:hypothetical protein
MIFEELDVITRTYMVREFDTEEAGARPYRGKGLSPQGIAAVPGLIRAALATGTEDSLIAALTVADYWNPTETYDRDGVVRERRVNVGQAAERLGLTEFNTWYVRGLCCRLLDEGVGYYEAYRAAQPRWEPGECQEHDGQVYEVSVIHRGHRARYWPEPGDASAISIPYGPGCHHTIRRYPSSPAAS